jgi:mono/diheme cytochrome c family protein
VAGAALAVAVRLRRAVTVSGALFGSGVGALALAIYLLATSGFSATTSASPGASNPYPPTAQSLTQGRTLYQANCQSCHGIGGKGDGPQAAALQPPPLDLTVHVGFHPDADLYRMISQGVRGTAMPPFAGLLTEEQRWHVINYIRTFDAARQTGQRP